MGRMTLVTALFGATLMVFGVPRDANAAMAMAQLKAGENFQFYVPGKLVVKRERADGLKSPQYLFAGQTGWRADGDISGEGNAILYWNGTMVLSKVSKKDTGSYSFPAEHQNPHLAATILEISVE